MENKKSRLRWRILYAFTTVQFISLMLTGVLFNIAIRFLPHTSYNQGENAGRSGATMFVSSGVMFIVSVVVSYFLANSITRPIEKLGKFALGLVKGGFETNDFSFRDIELENLNDALNKAARQIKAYDSEQKDFFQNASHELRTPLMSIKCYAEGIVYDIMHPKQASETILQETDKLSELVTDLLYIAKIDNLAKTMRNGTDSELLRGNTVYNFENTDIVYIMKECAKRQQAVSEKKGIVFAYDFPQESAMCHCIPELISRAVDNLISNAVRYAKDTITLSVKVNGGVEITVSDNGDGIPSEALPHVFERFYKGAGGNTGIGLSIVKSIAEQHGGYVTATNANGAVFTITLEE